MAAKRVRPLTLTAERVRHLFNYESETGIFRWKTVESKFSSAYVGKPVGTVRPDGYVSIGIDRNNYSAHRLAILVMTGSWPKGEVDHINGIRNDNRAANLRDVSAKVNQQNRRAAHRNNATGLLGVDYCEGEFRAFIKVDRKTRNLGSFSTPEAAHAAYLAAKRQLHQGCTL